MRLLPTSSQKKMIMNTKLRASISDRYEYPETYAELKQQLLISFQEGI